MPFLFIGFNFQCLSPVILSCHLPIYSDGLKVNFFRQHIDFMYVV